MKETSWDFEKLLQQNHHRLKYQLYRLKLESQEDYYQEGMIALWKANKKYQLDKGPLASYFNYMIRYRLIDAIRRSTINSHLYDDTDISLIAENRESYRHNPLEQTTKRDFWKQVQRRLTKKEWKWVKYYIIKQMPVKEIAQLEGVSERAVRGWGYRARAKLANIKYE